jgi:ABC-2 type transport system permease protein
MASHSSLQAVDYTLRPAKERGWRNGLANLLHNEIHAWWGTRTWLIQSLIWLVVVNGSMAMVLWTGPQPVAHAVAQSVFSIFTGILGALGVIVSTQGAVVAERQQGTAAWVLSKPVSRVAFLAAKWMAHALALFVTIILLQGSLAYAQFAAAGATPAVLPFLAGMGLLTLHLLSYLTLTLLLGTLFRSQIPVVAIAILILFVQPLLAEVYGFGGLLPGVLPLQVPPVLRGEPLPTIIPLISTTVLMVLCFIIAVWRFEREEF